MPIYVYECRDCKKRREIKHGFNDEIPKACKHYGGQDCEGEIRKVLQPAVPLYRCGGFHNTDYRR